MRTTEKGRKADKAGRVGTYMAIVVAARNEEKIYFCYDTKVETADGIDNMHKVQLIAPNIAVGEAFYLNHDFPELRLELRRREEMPMREAIADLFQARARDLPDKYEIPQEKRREDFPIQYVIGIMAKDGPHLYTTKGIWPKLMEVDCYGIGAGANHPAVHEELAKCHRKMRGVTIGEHLACAVRIAKIHDQKLGGIGRSYLGKSYEVREYTPFRSKRKPRITLEKLSDDQMVLPTQVIL